MFAAGMVMARAYSLWVDAVGLSCLQEQRGSEVSGLALEESGNECILYDARFNALLK